MLFFLFFFLNSNLLGVKVLFRVAIVLLKFTIGSPQQIADSQGLYETMEKLKHIPDSVVQEDFLVAEVGRQKWNLLSSTVNAVKFAGLIFSHLAAQ